MLTRQWRAGYAYAERGFHVFPCKPRGKDPLTPHGELDATTDAAMITRWARRWPNANIAIVPGMSGLFVLDVDVKYFGDESLASLPRLPDTATALTGGGGCHLWFRRLGYLEGLRCRTLRVPGVANSGIDIKGVCSGYLIVPPSIHPNGKPYLWELSSRVDEVPIAEPPQWLVSMVRRSGQREIKHSPHAMPVDPDSFYLGALFKKAGMLGRELRPGVFAVECPNAGAHSGKAKPGDSSSVIFAPEKPGGRGTFFCSHTSQCAEVFR